MFCFNSRSYSYVEIKHKIIIGCKPESNDATNQVWYGRKTRSTQIGYWKGEGGTQNAWERGSFYDQQYHTKELILGSNIKKYKMKCDWLEEIISN